MESADVTLEIHFGHSSSKNYPKALKLARRLPGFEEGAGTSDQHRLALVFGEIADHAKHIDSLVEIIGNWKGSEILYRGEVCSRDKYREVLSVARCHEERTTAVMPERHCQGYDGDDSWGCRYLRAIALGAPDHPWALGHQREWWFQFGSFEGDSTWIVDKQAMRGAMQRQANLLDLELCPAFSLEMIDTVLADLPDEIEIDDESDWEINYREAFSGGQIEKLPTGIKPKSRRRGPGIEVSLFGSEADDTDDSEQAREQARFVPEVSFEDVGGVEDILGQIREVIELPLLHPELFTHFGIAPHRGILLHGPPGCGKTLIAKAIAHEVRAHFISVRGPELVSKYYGESEGNLRAVFDDAHRHEPSIIFFDEIDSIARTRTDNDTNYAEDRLVNQLLTLMDGFDDLGRVCVIASTNRPDLIDSALKRPGRFDYTLEVSMPGPEAVARIFEIHTRSMPLVEGLDVHEFATQLHGLSGADIAFVAREGALNCIRQSLPIESLVHEEGGTDLDLNSLRVSEVDFRRALETILATSRTS